MENTLSTKDFDSGLPEELIAQTPIESRDASRLSTLDKISGEIQYRHLYDIINYLNPNDCLILNDSRVLPARIYGIKGGTRAKVEFLFLATKGDDVWEVLTGSGKRVKLGNHFSLGDGLMTAEVLEIIGDGNRLVKFSYQGNFHAVLDQVGQMPLPPCIKKKLEDKERYRTVYSHEVGSAAAPTAGPYFTKELLRKTREKGVKIRYMTLHVGLSTFRPVNMDKIIDHKMHSEHYWLPQETADSINETKKNGSRIISVGTIGCHTIESVAKREGCIKESGGFTDIFIYPGFQFKVLDGLITSFHLPESTLVMLASALTGREHILNAYRIAMQERYRFFSFDGAMFIGSKTE